MNNLPRFHWMAGAFHRITWASCAIVALSASAKCSLAAAPKPGGDGGDWGAAKLHQSIVYSDVGGRKLHLDIAVPDGKSPLPAIVMFPGNIPVPDPRQNLYPLMKFFVRRGYIVATVEYRGPSECRFPGSIDDAKNAVRFLRQHAAEYRVDPKHIGAWGMSMGGGVALMLAVTDDDFGTSKKGPHGGFSSQVQAVADRYGPADLTTMPLDAFHGLIMIWNLGTADPKSPELRDASPLSHVSKRSAPVLAEHSRKDQVVPYHQSELFCDALRKAGVPTQLREIIAAGHVAELSRRSAAGLAAGEACLKAEAAWFDRFLKVSKDSKAK